MNFGTTSPDGIERLQSGGRVSWKLPSREKVPGALAWILMAFGLVGCVFMFFWIRQAIGICGFLDENPPPLPFQLFGLVFAAVGIPGLGISLGILIAGWGLKSGNFRTEINLGDGRLKATERVPPFRWRWSRPALEIEKVVVSKIQGKIGPGSEMLAAIKIEGDFKKPLLIAPGYSEIILESLATEIAESLKGNVSHVIEVSEEIEKLDTHTPDPLTSYDLKEPAFTDLHCEHLGDGGIAFDIPRQGLKGPGKGVAFFAAIWNLFCLFIAGVFFATGAFEDDDAPIWVLALFGLVFFGAGIGMAVFALDLCLRRAVIGIQDGSLRLRRIRPLQGKADLVIPLEEIADIQVAPSGTEVNNEPILELRIERLNAKKLGLLSQVPESELRWIAAHLRQSAGMSLD